MEELIAAIRIKGMRDGLLVSLPEGSWEQQSAALLSQIDSKQAFFQGARLALDVGPQVVKVNQLVELRDRLSERSVSLWAVISQSGITEQTAQLLGLATRVSKPRPEEEHSSDTAPASQETALYINRTVRSGTRVEYQGSVVVLGDVNPGAEVIVHGSAIIWGRLRGTVHAGSAGDMEATICALEFAPTRLQVADEVLDASGEAIFLEPGTARIRNGSLVLEAWQAAGTGQT
jgi:septum site-determining protein MinC